MICVYIYIYCTLYVNMHIYINTCVSHICIIVYTYIHINSTVIYRVYIYKTERNRGAYQPNEMLWFHNAP